MMLCMGVLLPMVVTAWISIPFLPTRRVGGLQRSIANNDNAAWSTTDDWEALSADEQAPVSGWQVYGQDIVARAARRMEEQASAQSSTSVDEEDAWLEESLNSYLGQSTSDILDKVQEDTDISISSYQQQEEEATAVARMVRCQQPFDMVASSSSTTTATTSLDDRWEVLYDVHQLLQYSYINTTATKTTEKTSSWEPTPFLQTAVQTMFQMHARGHAVENEDTNSIQWDASSVAAWLRQSLDEPCGPHDARVTRVMALYGKQGILSSDGLVRLYVQALLQQEQGVKSISTLSPDQAERMLQRIQNQPSLRAVWKDLERHGIYPVAVTELNKAKQKTARQQASFTTIKSSDLIMDECEILEESLPDGWYQNEETGNWHLHGKNSHEKVRLASDGKTPLFLDDGEFIYIDEESCIGCTQCALASPASFQMLDTGRARTYEQRGRLPDVQAAVQTCPVNCMHYVGFARLMQLEQARDSINGDDGRTDHRHFGRDRRQGKWRPHTPLYVSRMESSDANHKDSLYHHVRRQCYRSHECPSKGCYDCPLHASNPDANPQHNARLAKNRHIRAQTFLHDGTADSYRRTAEI
jgi:ferredoxin